MGGTQQYVCCLDSLSEEAGHFKFHVTSNHTAGILLCATRSRVYSPGWMIS
jgi:hypothetical protein